MSAAVALCAGIDLGGSKIEARLFGGAAAETLSTRRRPTPRQDFPALLAALLEQIAWLDAEAAARGAPPVPIGLALPGPVDPQGGPGFTANLARGARSLAGEIFRASGRQVTAVNDAMAFALSEARGGAGAGLASVAGLVLGTGLGGGWCLGGALPPRAGGLAVELGHVGLSARARERHGLPLWDCGCGRQGCLEAYVSGPGLTRLAAHLTGRAIAPPDLGGAPEGAAVLALWAALAGEALDLLRLTLAPECIVLGGGLANLPGVEALLAGALPAFGAVPAPAICRAAFGDSSGARGAALLARDHATGRATC